MAAHRAQWKGFLKLGELSCGVALYTAASTADRITFSTINKATGNKVNRVFIDSQTEDPVPREAQTKGFEIENGEYIIVDPEEVAAAVPESDKTLEIEAFIPCSEVDGVFFDKPYYLAPSDGTGQDAFLVVRDGMKRAKVAAIARTVLFRRMRTVLIRPHENGLIATTLNFDYEIRSSKEAFENIPKMKIDREMLDLAKHIIDTKVGAFDPATFDDRYEAAVAEMVKSKLDGKAIPRLKKVAISKPGDLLAALRKSADMPKAAIDKPKRTAANANIRSGREKARSAAPAKSGARSKQRKAS